MIKTLTRSELNAIPIPQETRTYKPVSTHLIFDTVDYLCKEYQTWVHREEFETRQGGLKQKMRFQLVSDNERFSPEIVVLNSYDKSISLRVGSGSSAIICWNLMVLSNFKMQEKHMGDVQEDLVSFLVDAFRTQEEQVQNAQILWESFDQVFLTKAERMQLAGELFYEKELLDTNQANVLKGQLKKSSFDYDCTPNSLNELYQHTTFAVRNDHPLTFEQTHRRIQDYFVQYYEDVTNLQLM